MTQILALTLYTPTLSPSCPDEWELNFYNTAQFAGENTDPPEAETQNND